MLLRHGYLESILSGDHYNKIGCLDVADKLLFCVCILLVQIISMLTSARWSP
jgi:hypothetical protein